MALATTAECAAPAGPEYVAWPVGAPGTGLRAKWQRPLQPQARKHLRPLHPHPLELCCKAFTGSQPHIIVTIFPSGPKQECSDIHITQFSPVSADALLPFALGLIPQPFPLKSRSGMWSLNPSCQYPSTDFILRHCSRIDL
ncbi:unnamed protein product [Ectocarpus sp. CCAP 1310/34]|nr:unnamed protein product [Ectocarpus sp. CCAP 1310/34]